MTTELKPTYEDLKEFAIKIVQHGCWEGFEIGGDTIQDLAREHGIIVQVPFNPARDTDPNGDAETGDPWFVFAWSERAKQARQEADHDKA